MADVITLGEVFIVAVTPDILANLVEVYLLKLFFLLEQLIKTTNPRLKLYKMMFIKFNFFL